MAIEVKFTFDSEESLIAFMQRGRGSPAPKPAPEARASGQPTAPVSAAPVKTASVPAPIAQSAVAAAPVSTAATEGNAHAAIPETASPSASPVLSGEQEVSFEYLKKAFLALAVKPGGRALCEGVLKPVGAAKLSEVAEAQYHVVLAAIQKASA